MDISKLQQFLRDNIGDVTFREAFQKTQRILNITVGANTNFEIPKLLNYLTSPDVVRFRVPIYLLP